jgi:hypothetical protein
MIKLKGDLMFDKVIIRILFNILDNWNITHIEHWLKSRKIKFINIKQSGYYYVVNIQKITKDVQLIENELKGERGVYFHSL